MAADPALVASLEADQKQLASGETALAPTTSSAVATRPIDRGGANTPATGVRRRTVEMLTFKGDAYRSYQARVSRFVPGPPKRM